MNAKSSLRKDLCQDWVHVQEEDQPQEQVFRPERMARSVSQGRGGDLLRTRLTLREDGSCRISGTGPNDRPSVEEGRYRILDRDPLALEIRLDGGSVISIDVAAVEPDRLLVRKS